MEFCPSCGTRLILKSRSRRSIYCPKCGYTSKLLEGSFLKGEFSIVNPSNPSIAVLDRKALNLRTLPSVSAYCQKCGGNKAETWTITVGSNDISSVIFYRCVSCGYTWRETD